MTSSSCDAAALAARYEDVCRVTERPSYRNFFPPDARWQFSGIRLADDA